MSHDLRERLVRVLEYAAEVATTVGASRLIPDEVAALKRELALLPAAGGAVAIDRQMTQALAEVIDDSRGATSTEDGDYDAVVCESCEAVLAVDGKVREPHRLSCRIEPLERLLAALTSPVGAGGPLGIKVAAVPGIPEDTAVMVGGDGQKVVMRLAPAAMPTEGRGVDWSKRLAEALRLVMAKADAEGWAMARLTLREYDARATRPSASVGLPRDAWQLGHAAMDDFMTRFRMEDERGAHGFYESFALAWQVLVRHWDALRQQPAPGEAEEAAKWHDKQAVDLYEDAAEYSRGEDPMNHAGGAKREARYHELAARALRNQS